MHPGWMRRFCAGPHFAQGTFLVVGLLAGRVSDLVFILDLFLSCCLTTCLVKYQHHFLFRFFYCAKDFGKWASIRKQKSQSRRGRIPSKRKLVWKSDDVAAFSSPSKNMKSSFAAQRQPLIKTLEFVLKHEIILPPWKKSPLMIFCTVPSYHRRGLSLLDSSVCILQWVVQHCPCCDALRLDLDEWHRCGRGWPRQRPGERD